ncbi:MAG: LLM class flavin-dependent oxidoreductase [Alphaproteobacteria bacterium]|nr:LLM class flavin-dependent oxidoreductase [Alphaproteobacteria bacterium]
MTDKPFQRLEIGLYSISSTKDNCAVARQAEARGFGRVWLAEDHHSRDIFVQASAVAGATKSIEIALGIVNPYTRHPAQIAMGVADLEEWGGPRVVLGLGAAWSSINAHGLQNPRPIRALREASEICRRLLGGERVTYAGEVFRLPAPGAQLSFPLARRGVPIYFGTMGPKTLAMAAPIADGLLFSVFASPAFVKDRLTHVRSALSRAGRSIADIDIACYVIFSVAKDGAAARRTAKKLVSHYLRRIRDKERFAFAGLDVPRMEALQAELKAAFDQGRVEEAVDLVPDDVLDALAVAGTPDQCVAGLKAYAAAGIKAPVLYHALGPDRVAAVDLIADAVRPHLIASQGSPTEGRFSL